jgi:hypothetical protein
VVDHPLSKPMMFYRQWHERSWHPVGRIFSIRESFTPFFFFFYERGNRKLFQQWLELTFLTATLVSRPDRQLTFEKVGHSR